MSASRSIFEKYLAGAREDNPLFRLFVKKDENLECILTEVANVSRQKGFPELHCSVWMVNKLIFSGLFKDYAGLALFKPPRIFIFQSSIWGYRKDDLKLLIAHEYAHLISRFTCRVGHPLFARLRRMNDEDFANFLTAYLYSKEMLLKSARDFGFLSDEFIAELSKTEITAHYEVKER